MDEAGEMQALGERDRVLLDLVKDRDMECPVCEYNVRNLTSPRCPECGTRLVLRLGLKEAGVKAWVAALVPLLLCAGIGCYIVVMLTLTRAWPSGKMLPVMTCFVLSILPAGGTLLGRRRFYQCGGWTRALWVATAWGGAGVLLGWVVVGG